MNIIHRIGSLFLDFIETIVIALSIFLVIYLFFLQPHQVNGQSMVPNFQNGEYVLTDKVTFKMRDPRRGEVIVFHAPAAAHCPLGTGCDFIKRVIALPGEVVEVKDGHIYIDSKELNEPYIPSDFVTQPGEFSKNRVITLGPDEFFAVGDNRPYSSDSRAWGPITKDAIVGRAFFVYWPPQAVGTIPKVEY